MTAISLTDPIFTDEEAARQHFEKLRWPDGPVCPHCGSVDNATELQGKSHRPGLYKCHDCQKPFTATIGTLYERSHIPLHKWLLATHLMCASKKGISAHQLYRMLGFGSYRTAWFMAHRIREGMRVLNPSAKGGLGGADKIVEADESYVGGKAKNRAFRDPAPKKIVFTLVERNGEARSFHIANVTAQMVRPIIVQHASRKSHLMTDESYLYHKIGDEFAGHSTVNHSADEYVRLGGFAHTNTVEAFFSILKRGITGTYHTVSEAHLHRYLAEFDYRHNTRTALGFNDTERAAKAVKGVEGKRLLYRGTSLNHAH
jgi:transposase-like protein